MDNKEINTSQFNWSDKIILIAEDEIMNYLYLEEALRETQAKVIWSKNGQEAVEKVVAEKIPFDVILMDVKMPIMNGYEATKIIKKYKPEMPIIIQTAYAMQNEKQKGYDAGCDEYLEKPIKQERLLLTVNKFFK
ncbi:MAG: response regulator [Bacteroidetes bacterium]|nr:response regulator [Bacteroidales bacterium]RLD52416.1 MAG: response regulator [Bacteroidota bacterium]